MGIDEIVQENIAFGNYEFSSDEIICPYCGYSKDVDVDMWFGDSSVRPYEEGDEDITCLECGYTFTLEKRLSWDYRAYIKEAG